MSIFEAFIPLVAGLFLVLRPQAFFKKTSSAEEIGNKAGKLRKMGYNKVYSLVGGNRML